MLTVVLGLFGLVVGSFLNVVIVRHGEKSLSGRSACVSCARTLEWYELVPVLSWVVLLGRCRTCRARISLQYPLVELATTLLFAALAGAGLEPLPLVIALVIASLLIALFVYDLRHTIIPDVWVYPFCFLALALSWMLFGLETSPLVLLASGPVAALPLFALWAMSRGRWMGFGDVKLALGMGWLLGFPLGLVSVMFAFVIGAFVSVGILLPLPHIRWALSRVGITRLEQGNARFTMASEVPFGPFLITSCLIVWFMVLYQVPVPIFSYYG